MKFLVVDDFPMIRTMVKKSLIDLGYKDVVEACDGVEAWEALEAAQRDGVGFDAVFVDWNMPRMTGIELVEKCKACAELKHIPLVVITAERDKGNVVRALKAGAADYIVKPFSPKILSEKLTRIIPANGNAKKASNE